jgi:hypothetical protein
MEGDGWEPGKNVPRYPNNIQTHSPPPRKIDQLKNKIVVIRKQRWNRHTFGC